MVRKNVVTRKVLAKVRKDLKNKKKIKPGLRLSRRAAINVLSQGAVAAPRKIMGSKPAQGNVRSMIKALDARVPRSLGLPRAVGPYTVMRTTVLHKSSAEFLIFCPFLEATEDGQKWYNWCGVEDVDAALGITAADNTSPIFLPMYGLGDACEVVPSALTVQVMNPEALQGANGIFAMTRVNQQLNMANSSNITWRELKSRVVSFYSPRLLTGGKLALKGVKCTSYPLDMNEYATFAPIRKTSTAVGTWNSSMHPGALAPIVFLSNNDAPVNLEFMVTVEWRVRFDPGNPATSTHSFHPTVSDKAWNDVIRTMSNAGHGVEDLAEDVAAAGAMYGAAAAFA